MKLQTRDLVKVRGSTIHVPAIPHDRCLRKLSQTSTQLCPTELQHRNMHEKFFLLAGLSHALSKYFRLV